MRTPKLTLIIGTNGTGKSTFVEALKNNVLASNRRVLIVTPDFAEWQGLPEITTENEIYNFTEAAKIIYEDENTLLNIYNNYHNGLLVFDDYKAFGLAGKQAEITLRRLCIRRRQKMLDMAFVAHGFTELVPYFIFTFSTDIVLFRTIDNISRVRHVLRDPYEVYKAQKKINKLAIRKPHIFKILKQ